MSVSKIKTAVVLFGLGSDYNKTGIPSALQPEGIVLGI